MVTALNSFKRQSPNAPLFSLKVSNFLMHHTLLLAIPSQNGIVSWCTSESQVFRLLLNTTRGNGIRKQALEVRWCPPELCCHWRYRTAITSLLSSLHRGFSGHQHNIPSPVPTQRTPSPATLAQQASSSTVAGRPPPNALPPQ